MRTWLARPLLISLAFVSAFLLFTEPGFTQEDEIIAGGRGKYEQYCAACHGPLAKGDGPLTKLLTVKPADLTQLSKRNHGQFPFWRVYRTIDGREAVGGHGSREMPLWGSIFQVEESATQAPYQADIVRGRIWQLVYFLESIQEK